jgi:hypothetical protein
MAVTNNNVDTGVQNQLIEEQIRQQQVQQNQPAEINNQINEVAAAPVTESVTQPEPSIPASETAQVQELAFAADNTKASLNAALDSSPALGTDVVAIVSPPPTLPSIDNSVNVDSGEATTSVSPTSNQEAATTPTTTPSKSTGGVGGTDDSDKPPAFNPNPGWTKAGLTADDKEFINRYPQNKYLFDTNGGKDAIIWEGTVSVATGALLNRGSAIYDDINNKLGIKSSDIGWVAAKMPIGTNNPNADDYLKGPKGVYVVVKQRIGGDGPGVNGAGATSPEAPVSNSSDDPDKDLSAEKLLTDKLSTDEAATLISKLAEKPAKLDQLRNVLTRAGDSRTTTIPKATKDLVAEAFGKAFETGQANGDKGLALVKSLINKQAENEILGTTSNFLVGELVARSKSPALQSAYSEESLRTAVGGKSAFVLGAAAAVATNTEGASRLLDSINKITKDTDQSRVLQSLLDDSKTIIPAGRDSISTQLFKVAKEGKSADGETDHTAIKNQFLIYVGGQLTESSPKSLREETLKYFSSHTSAIGKITQSDPKARETTSAFLDTLRKSGDLVSIGKEKSNSTIGVYEMVSSLFNSDKSRPGQLSDLDALFNNDKYPELSAIWIEGVGSAVNQAVGTQPTITASTFNYPNVSPGNGVKVASSDLTRAGLSGQPGFTDLANWFGRLRAEGKTDGEIGLLLRSYILNSPKEATRAIGNANHGTQRKLISEWLNVAFTDSSQQNKGNMALALVSGASSGRYETEARDESPYLARAISDIIRETNNSQFKGTVGLLGANLAEDYRKDIAQGNFAVPLFMGVNTVANDPNQLELLFNDSSFRKDINYQVLLGFGEPQTFTNTMYEALTTARKAGFGQDIFYGLANNSRVASNNSTKVGMVDYFNTQALNLSKTLSSDNALKLGKFFGNIVLPSDKLSEATFSSGGGFDQILRDSLSRRLSEPRTAVHTSAHLMGALYKGADIVKDGAENIKNLGNYLGDTIGGTIPFVIDLGPTGANIGTWAADQIKNGQANQVPDVVKNVDRAFTDSIKQLAEELNNKGRLGEATNLLDVYYNQYNTELTTFLRNR